MSRNRLIVIGRVVKAFGIRGEIKISPFTESFESFERSGVLFLDESPYTVRSVRIHKKAVLASLEGVDTPDKADELVGRLVKTDQQKPASKGGGRILLVRINRHEGFHGGWPLPG